MINHHTAIFRQINKDRTAAHHDALEFPDGQIVLLTFLCEGQQATVLQLPAELKIAIESDRDPDDLGEGEEPAPARAEGLRRFLEA